MMTRAIRHLSQNVSPDAKTLAIANRLTPATVQHSVREAPSVRSTIGAERSDDIGQVFRCGPPTQHPIHNIGIVLLEQNGKAHLFCGGCLRVALIQIALQQQIQFMKSAPTLPAQTRTCTRGIALRGKLAHTGIKFVPYPDYSSRLAINRLISPMALAGLRSLGQVLVQFRIV